MERVINTLSRKTEPSRKLRTGDARGGGEEVTIVVNNVGKSFRDLPDAVLGEILKRVTALDTIKLKVVCKLWDSTMSSPLFRNTFTSQNDWIARRTLFKDLQYQGELSPFVFLFWDQEMTSAYRIRIPVLSPPMSEPENYLVADSDKDLICFHRLEMHNTFVPRWWGDYIYVINPITMLYQNLSLFGVEKFSRPGNFVQLFKVLKLSVDLNPSGAMRQSFKVYAQQLDFDSETELGSLLVYDSTLGLWIDTDILLEFHAEQEFVSQSVTIMEDESSLTFAGETSKILPMGDGSLYIFTGELEILLRYNALDNTAGKFSLVGLGETGYLQPNSTPVTLSKENFGIDILRIFKFDEKVFFFRMRIHELSKDPAVHEKFMTCGIWHLCDHDKSKLVWEVESMMPSYLIGSHLQCLDSVVRYGRLELLRGTIIDNMFYAILDRAIYHDAIPPPLVITFHMTKKMWSIAKPQSASSLPFSYWGGAFHPGLLKI